MKKVKWTLAAALFTLVACNKSNDAAQVSLTPSVTQATVGQTVTVTLASDSKTSNWTVTPAANANLSYGLTTNKVNYVTFSQAGSYTVSARTADGGRSGGCTHGIDSASVTITVVDK